MIRKLLIAGGGVALLGALVVGRDVVSYLRTSAGYVTDAVQESVPIEFQIDRARGMIKDLVPEVRKNMHVIAKEEVEVQAARRADRREPRPRLAKEKEQMLRLKTDLAAGKAAFTYAGRELHGRRGQDRSGQPLRALQDGRGHAGQPAGDPQRPAEEPGGRPAEARRHVGLEAAVAGRGREPRGPLPDDRRRPDHQQLPVRRQPTGPGQGTGRRTCGPGWKWPRSWSTPRPTTTTRFPWTRPTPENIVEQVTEHFAAEGNAGDGKGGAGSRHDRMPKSCHDRGLWRACHVRRCADPDRRGQFAWVAWACHDVADRFMLWVDAVGGYWVCLGDEVDARPAGPAGRGRRADPGRPVQPARPHPPRRRRTT